MRRSLSLLIVTLASGPAAAAAQEPDDPLMASYRARTQVVRPCDRSGGAIVVCGSRSERNARERLPLPREAQEGQRIRDAAPRASAAPTRQGACGVVGGQGAGCVGGWNGVKMIDTLVKGVTLLLDPDADVEPPPSMPGRTGRASPR